MSLPTEAWVREIDFLMIIVQVEILNLYLYLVFIFKVLFIICSSAFFDCLEIRMGLNWGDDLDIHDDFCSEPAFFTIKWYLPQSEEWQRQRSEVML